MIMPTLDNVILWPAKLVSRLADFNAVSILQSHVVHIAYDEICNFYDFIFGAAFSDFLSMISGTLVGYDISVAR